MAADISIKAASLFNGSSGAAAAIRDIVPDSGTRSIFERLWGDGGFDRFQTTNADGSVTLDLWDEGKFWQGMENVLLGKGEKPGLGENGTAQGSSEGAAGSSAAGAAPDYLDIIAGGSLKPASESPLRDALETRLAGFMQDPPADGRIDLESIAADPQTFLNGLRPEIRAQFEREQEQIRLAQRQREREAQGETGGNEEAADLDIEPDPSHDAIAFMACALGPAAGRIQVYLNSMHKGALAATGSGIEEEREEEQFKRAMRQQALLSVVESQVRNLNNQLNTLKLEQDNVQGWRELMDGFNRIDEDIARRQREKQDLTSERERLQTETATLQDDIRDSSATRAKIEEELSRYFGSEVRYDQQRHSFIVVENGQERVLSPRELVTIQGDIFEESQTQTLGELQSRYESALAAENLWEEQLAAKNGRLAEIDSRLAVLDQEITGLEEERALLKQSPEYEKLQTYLKEHGVNTDDPQAVAAFLAERDAALGREIETLTTQRDSLTDTRESLAAAQEMITQLGGSGWDTQTQQELAQILEDKNAIQKQIDELEQRYQDNADFAAENSLYLRPMNEDGLMVWDDDNFSPGGISQFDLYMANAREQGRLLGELETLRDKQAQLEDREQALLTRITDVETSYVNARSALESAEASMLEYAAAAEEQLNEAAEASTNADMQEAQHADKAFDRALATINVADIATDFIASQTDAINGAMNGIAVSLPVAEGQGDTDKVTELKTEQTVLAARSAFVAKLSEDVSNGKYGTPQEIQAAIDEYNRTYGIEGAEEAAPIADSTVRTGTSASAEVTGVITNSFQMAATGEAPLPGQAPAPVPDNKYQAATYTA